MSGPPDRQRQHYEQIHDDYERHYYDLPSREFRRRFVEDAFFEGLELDGKNVADLACGSGHGSRALLTRFPHARPVGFDISPRACSAYRRNLGLDCHEMDLTVGGYDGPRFDVGNDPRRSPSLRVQYRGHIAHDRRPSEARGCLPHARAESRLHARERAATLVSARSVL